MLRKTKVDPIKCIDRSTLGEAIHTAFRKGGFGPNSSTIWKLIDEMPNGEWKGILDFIWECMWEPTVEELALQKLAKKS
jgi:hypothetical protein